MQITVLADNHCARESCKAEHGFSCLVEYGGHALLYDTGSSGLFLENAAAMGVDLSKTETVVLSHAHFDHSRGFLSFAQAGFSGYRLLVHADFFTPKYWETENGLRYVGNAFSQELISLHGLDALLIREKTFPLDEQGRAFLLSGFPRHTGFEQIDPTSRKYVAGRYVQDDFTEELVLAVHTAGGLVLVSGCSHSGIANICLEAEARFAKPVCAVVGGTHLVASTPGQVQATVQFFNSHPSIATVATAHCTGEDAMGCLRAGCKAFTAVGAGSVLAFRD